MNRREMLKVAGLGTAALAVGQWSSDYRMIRLDGRWVLCERLNLSSFHGSVESWKPVNKTLSRDGGRIVHLTTNPKSNKASSWQWEVA